MSDEDLNKLVLVPMTLREALQSKNACEKVMRKSQYLRAKSSFVPQPGHRHKEEVRAEVYGRLAQYYQLVGSGVDPVVARVEVFFDQTLVHDEADR